MFIKSFYKNKRDSLTLNRSSKQSIRLFGYAKVSTRQQFLDIQIKSFKEAAVRTNKFLLIRPQVITADRNTIATAFPSPAYKAELHNNGLYDMH
ncbi:hypothetical protein [Arsenophonus nasoniae]|uniref:Putative resolvase n=1 Tax=Arsenophonus nasoniae TaxID=638 RepID=D2U425_9GAMM|nr:Transposon gamma-delta resolvase [Arsenophonus nasoniae]CBA76243.1 putative resolvase [Arsenophonus nasoniae]